VGQWPSPPDSGNGDSSGLTLTTGGIVTVGRVPGGAALTLTDDGFELDERRCNGSLCLAGGITP
jgi:hypothetical protein